MGFGGGSFLVVKVQDRLYLRLELGSKSLFFLHDGGCVELVLFKFYLVVSGPPQGFGDGHQSIGEKDHHKKHPEGIRCG